MIRRRVLSEYDRAVWAVYAQQLRPLPGVSIPGVSVPDISVSGISVSGVSVPAAPSVAAVPVMVPAPRDLPAPAPRPGRGRLGPIAVGTHPPGVDRATWERFRSGKLPAARTLDLHGRTAGRAFTALHGFLGACHAEGLRCVEVITGRGAGEGGVIRREFPIWLNEPGLRSMVLAAAHPHAANPGSVRLLLRRIRG